MKFVSWFLMSIRVVAIAAFLCAPIASGAGPCEEPEAPSARLDERIDGWFGDWVVHPIATVLFFDLWFWDNTLPMGTLPAAESFDDDTPEQRQASIAQSLTQRGKELIGYSDGYRYRCRTPARLRDVRPVFAEDATVKRGLLTLRLTERGDDLWGVWDAVSIDPVALGLREDAPADAPRIGRVLDVMSEDGRIVKEVEISALAPFPVRIDVEAGLLLAGETPLSWEEFPIIAGQRVRWQDQVLEVAAIDGRRLSLRTLEDEVDLKPIPNPHEIKLPLVVIWLVVGAAFFTLRFAFINIRAFPHAIAVVSGRYDQEGDPGEVTHFQALASALSATVGLGNIAGVAVAVAAGGPGAVVWMMIAAFLGMSSKFAEVTLGQMYRLILPDGTVSGGPMHYLSTGLAQIGLKRLGSVLAILFAVMCIGGSLGGGNMFQGNQSFQAIADVVPALKPRAEGVAIFERLPSVGGEITVPEGTAIAVPGGAVFVTAETFVLATGETSTPPIPIAALHGGGTGNVDVDAVTEITGHADPLGRITPTDLDDLLFVRNPTPTKGGQSWGIAYGLVLTVLIGLVIIGGIKRIGATAGYIVPAMAVLYVLAGTYILVAQGVSDPSSLTGAFSAMLQSAFTVEAGIGGMIGVIMTGFQRASFSNEAGVGSASIAHSAAATKEPVSEGVVALLEPFIDTLIVCAITGLVVVSTGTYQIAGLDGISMTSAAFESGGLPGARYVLAAAVVLFAFSTMISWSYYGDRAATWLFGDWVSTPYKVLFLTCAVLGPIITLGNVIEFSDLMVLGMAFPNILGLYLLSGKVSAALRDYLDKLRRGAL